MRPLELYTKLKGLLRVFPVWPGCPNLLLPAKSDMYRGTAASPNRHLMRLHLVRVVLPCSMLALLVGVAHGQTPASVVIESGGSLTIRSSGHLDIGAPQATADATSTDSPLAPPPSSSPSPPTPPSLPPSSPNIVGFMNTYLNGRCHDASNQMYDAAQYTLSEEACRTMCLQYTHCPGVSWWVSTDPTSACSVVTLPPSITAH